jgi:hypothetical protein
MGFHPWSIVFILRSETIDKKIRTYAVGVLSLRQSGTSSFGCVRFFRAPRRKTAHKRIDKYHAAAGKKRGVEPLNKATA